MATPISKVKTSPQQRTAKTSAPARSKAPVKTLAKVSGTVVGAGIADQISVGARSVDPGMAQIDKLGRLGRTRGAKGNTGTTPPPTDSGSTKRTTPQGPAQMDGTKPITNTGSPGGQIEVTGKKTYGATDTGWMQDQNQRHIDAHQRKLDEQARETAKAGKTAKAPDIEGPKTTGGTKLKGALSVFGGSASAFQTIQGINKVLDGNYLEGGLEFVTGGGELLAEASDIDKARRARAAGTAATSSTAQAAAKTVSKGQALKRIAAKGAGVAFALVDAAHAAQSLRAGNEVAATEHAMNSVCGAISLLGAPAATGAVIYTGTRIAMSNTGGDKFVTDRMESVFFPGDRADDEQRDATNRSHADAVGGMRGQDRVNYMKKNQKRAALALIGLQTALSEAKNSQEKAQIQQRLHEVRRAKDQAFG